MGEQGEKVTMKPDWLSTHFSDLIIITKSQIWNVHQVVLAHESLVFKNLFLSDYHGKGTRTIHLQEDAPEAFAHLLEYLYSNGLPFKSTNDTSFKNTEACLTCLKVIPLYGLAHKYNVVKLKTQLVNYFKILTTDFQLGFNDMLALVGEIYKCKSAKNGHLSGIVLNLIANHLKLMSTSSKIHPKPAAVWKKLEQQMTKMEGFSVDLMKVLAGA